MFGWFLSNLKHTHTKTKQQKKQNYVFIGMILMAAYFKENHQLKMRAMVTLGNRFAIISE